MVLANHNLVITCLLLLAAQAISAQELEPRRWSHLPVGANFLGIAAIYTDSDILVDPSIQLENVNGDVYAVALSYTRALDFFGKSGRIDLLLPYSTARWDGLLQGQPASTRRSGLNDPKVRFAVNLLGSPAQRGAAFRPAPSNTIVGVALEVTLPLGEYDSDKLINLGNNRWVFRPQAGMVHSWGNWAAELTGSVWFYSDNDDFFQNTTRKQDRLLSAQTHLIYTWRPGLWGSASLAYGNGARSEIDGVELNDRIGKLLYAVSVGVPINRTQGVKISFIGGETRQDTGNDYQRFLLTYSLMWGD